MECLSIINPSEISDYPVPEKNEGVVSSVLLKPILNLPDKKIKIQSHNDETEIQIANIILCKAVRKKTEIVCVKNSSYKIDASLSDIEQILKPYRFVRAHKEYIINIDYITAISGKKNIKIQLLEHHNVPCSDYFIHDIKNLMDAGIILVEASSN